MSASNVRKGLAIVDGEFYNNKVNGNSKRKANTNLMPDNYKLRKKIINKGHKETIEVLKTDSKLTVVEARKQFKSKEEKLKENLQKLELLDKLTKIDLDKDITRQLIERAVTKRPVKAINKKPPQKTGFTEEDFIKFEKEYFKG